MTRLPSNLTQDHPQMRALVTRVHFRSHDKDDSYTTRYAIPKNRTLRANITALCFIEKELFCWSMFYIAGIGIFDIFGSCELDLDPMAFTYELDP